MADSNRESSEAWQPSEIDRTRADNGYMRYIAGVAILHNPHTTRAINGRNAMNAPQRTDITVHAKSLIWAGLQDVITYANTPDTRTGRKMEAQFDEAFPYMDQTRHRVARRWGRRLDEVLSAATVHRPLPVLEEPVYKALVHPHKEKLYVADVMGVWNTDPVFSPELWSQDFTDVPAGHKPISGLHSQTD